MDMNSRAEVRATDALRLAAFHDANLVGIKAKVAQALSLIGRSGVFSEYTLHDISHVDKMLGTLDWMIPEETQDLMSPADWLLIVLSIYLHDLGMLVTDDEFDARGESDFYFFCEQNLFAGDPGTDYADKVAALGEDRERFLYQEYVRHHHADRISDWINGSPSKRLGAASTVAKEIAAMVRDLPLAFRTDLALACASHHLNDLYDTSRYRIASPYGDSDEETANVQYASLLLRSSDLLHITNDRTPSVMFRLINPQDPLSQREWAKQEGVARVKAQKGKADDGTFDSSIPPDTVEVFASFRDADAFFGLTSYLSYAEKELRQVAEWADASCARFDIKYAFPWRFVDTTEVRADGFSPRQLSFTLDQDKILELLTGHTLYNDTSVVIRELVQNALDAARLQAHIAGTDSASGAVEVEWISDLRELVVRDNGVGMTASVIERNLLKAGSSRYQEEDFRDKYPEFSSISRFGIGVLSTFMIADWVQITTASDDEIQAHQLTLRSVHGRYLVRLLDKETECPFGDRRRGTEVRLKVRKSAELPDIAETLRRWIVIPRCSVTATQDGSVVADVGFDSPKAALEEYLANFGLILHAGNGEPEDRTVKVIEKTYDQTYVAFPVRWSRYYKQWEFLRMSSLDSDANAALAAGTCVGGIRVEETSPGFTELSVSALVDARGTSAPKTNVARAGLEVTPARQELLHRVYRAYLEHIAEEGLELVSARNQSPTWAAQESEAVLGLLLEKDRDGTLFPVVDSEVLGSELDGQPLLLVESDGSRTRQSGTDLDGVAELWTVDSGLVRAAESILREIQGEGSLHAIASSFSGGAFSLPSGVTLVGYRQSSLLHRMALRDREVLGVIIRADERRVDLKWGKPEDSQLWLQVNPSESGRRIGLGHHQAMYVARRDFAVDGRERDTAIRAHETFYLFHDTALAKYIVETIDGGGSRDERAMRGEILSDLTSRFLGRSESPPDMTEFVNAAMSGMGIRRIGALNFGWLDVDELISVFEGTSPKTFDTWAWSRRDYL